MAAPSPTARQTPTGRRIPEGFTTKVTFTSQPALGVWERKVKPLGADAGEMIDISTMFNSRLRTYQPQALHKHEQVTMECGIDPDAIATLETLISLQDTITISYPDGSTEAYFGALMKYEFSDFSIGEFPLVTLTIGATDCQPSDFAEQAPVLTQAAGT